MTKKIFPITILFLFFIAALSAASSDLFGAKGANVASDPTIEDMLTYAI